MFVRGRCFRCKKSGHKAHECRSESMDVGIIESSSEDLMGLWDVAEVAGSAQEEVGGSEIVVDSGASRSVAPVGGVPPYDAGRQHEILSGRERRCDPQSRSTARRAAGP